MFTTLTSSGILQEATTWAKEFNAIIIVVVGMGVAFAVTRFVKNLFN